MSTFKLNQVLMNQDLWDIPQAIRNYTNDLYPHSDFMTITTQSRTLTDMLSSVMGHWGNRNTSFKFLLGMCAKTLNKVIYAMPYYKLITSEESVTLTIESLKNIISSRINRTGVKINFVHIPKGKSYAKTVLDKTEDLERVKGLETFFIEDTQHFVRVYRNFKEPGDVTIFSDRFNTRFRDMFFLMLPNVLDISTIPTESDIAVYPEDINIEEYNTKIIALRKIFEYLYNFYTDNTTNELNNEEIKTNLTRLMRVYAELFNWNTENLDKFAEALAKAQDARLNTTYKNNLASTTSRIKQLEDELERLYPKKVDLERTIAGLSTITATHVQPFLTTLQNTKAIEILSCTERALKIRVTAPLQFFTSSDFTAYERNASSEYNQLYKDKPVIQSILRKIFATKEYKLPVQAIIKIEISPDYETNAVRCNAGSYDAQLSDYTQLPNPHLWHHNCWDRARNEINKFIASSNYELAIMQIVAAVQSINIAEHTSFVYDLLHNDLRNPNYLSRTHIIDKEGKEHTWSEMLIYEKELLDKEKLAEAEKELKDNKEGYKQIVIDESTDIEDNDEDDWEDENEDD